MIMQYIGIGLSILSVFFTMYYARKTYNYYTETRKIMGTYERTKNDIKELTNLSSLFEQIHKLVIKYLNSPTLDGLNFHSDSSEFSDYNFKLAHLSSSIVNFKKSTFNNLENSLTNCSIALSKNTTVENEITTEVMLLSKQLRVAIRVVNKFKDKANNEMNTLVIR